MMQVLNLVLLDNTEEATTTFQAYDVVSEGAMNPSSSTLITSPFSSLLRLPSISKRCHFRVSFPRCSSASSLALAPIQKDLNGIELIIDKLSPLLRLATSAVIVAGAVAAGYTLGSRFSGSQNASLGGAAALGVASSPTTCSCSISCGREFA